MDRADCGSFYFMVTDTPGLTGWQIGACILIVIGHGLILTQIKLLLVELEITCLSILYSLELFISHVSAHGVSITG